MELGMRSPTVAQFESYLLISPFACRKLSIVIGIKQLLIVYNVSFIFMIYYSGIYHEDEGDTEYKPVRAVLL